MVEISPLREAAQPADAGVQIHVGWDWKLAGLRCINQR